MSRIAVFEPLSDIDLTLDKLERVIKERCVAFEIHLAPGRDAVSISMVASKVVDGRILKQFVTISAKTSGEKVRSIEAGADSYHLNVLKAIAAGCGGTVTIEKSENGLLQTKQLVVSYNAPPSIAAQQGERLSDIDGLRSVTPCFNDSINRGYAGVYDLRTAVAVLKAENYDEADIAYVRRERDRGTREFTTKGMPISINEGPYLNVAIICPSLGTMTLRRRIDMSYKAMNPLEIEDLSAIFHEIAPAQPDENRMSI